MFCMITGQVQGVEHCWPERWHAGILELRRQGDTNVGKAGIPEDKE